MHSIYQYYTPIERKCTIVSYLLSFIIIRESFYFELVYLENYLQFVHQIVYPEP